MRAWSVRRSFVRAVLVVALVVTTAPIAQAIVVGTGRLTAVDFDGSPPNLTFDGDFRWDDDPFDVLGTPVNLGETFPGDQAVANGVVTELDIGDLSAGFVVDLLSSSPATAFLNLNDVTGSAVCTAPNCVGATATFVGVASDVDASAGLLPSDPLVYAIDGSITIDFTLNGSGPFGLNAFAPQTTPAGSDVVVGSGDDTFYDSLQDEILGFAATVQFAVVHEPGVTLFQALSTAEGAIPANIVLDPPGLESIFIDITTTALYGGSVLVCIVVPDGTTIPLDDLRLLHREGAGAGSPEGAFVDITEFTETSPDRVCGFVSSLSPFVLGAVLTEPTTTTTTSTTTSITVSTTTTSTIPSTSTTVGPTTTTVVTSTTVTSTTIATSTTAPSTTSTSSSTSSSTTSSTSSTTTTSLPPTCIAAPTFASILCRLDELIAVVEESDIDEPTRGNLLRSLQAARDKTASAEDRADAGRTRGAKGRLKSAARSLNSVLFRLRSLNGSRRIPPELAAELTAMTSPIQDDMTTLRGSL